MDAPPYTESPPDTGHNGHGSASAETQVVGTDAVISNGGAADHPPPYHAEILVLPFTSEQSRRYDKLPLRDGEQPRHLQVQIGLFSMYQPEMPNVPTGWIELVHPEGQRYYFHPHKRVVTDTNLRDPNCLRLILLAAGIIDAKALAVGITLPTTTELVLELEESQFPPICRYYFIDHSHKTEFWLEVSGTDVLGLPPVTSYTHLKYLFRQHYWTHIEFYPVHYSLPVEVEEELIAVLSHALIDFMTSNLSTVPYNQQQCEAYIKAIQGLPESDRIDGYRNCIIARLWAEIDSNYFVNLHGESNPRLSRTQRLLAPPTAETTLWLNVSRALLFNAPEYYNNAISELWVDRISYASHWSQFVGRSLEEWKNTNSWSSLLLVSSCVILGAAFTQAPIQPIPSTVVQASSLVSTLCSLTSLGSSLVLQRRHSNQLEYSATEVGEYLEGVNHPKYGLLPVSIVMALPWAMCVWAYIFLIVSLIGSTFLIVNWVGAVVVGIAIVVLLRIGYFVVTTLNIASTPAILGWTETMHINNVGGVFRGLAKGLLRGTRRIFRSTPGRRFRDSEGSQERLLVAEEQV